jgi:hypothetical protein
MGIKLWAAENLSMTLLLLLIACEKRGVLKEWNIPERERENKY